MEPKILKNVRFQNLFAGLETWKNVNPVILPGELALVKDDHNRMKIKIGTGMTFNDTAFMYSMDRWTSSYKNLSEVDDTNVKPADNNGYNTEDFIQINGDLIYPINLTTSVKLRDGRKLQSWMNNVETGDITMSGDLKIVNPEGSSYPDRQIIRIIEKTTLGSDIAFAAGGNTILASGEADYMIQKILNTSSENLYLASDQSVFLYAKCQTESEIKNITFNGDVFYPGSNKSINLGATSSRWKNIYADCIDLDTFINVPRVEIKNNVSTTIKGITGLTGNDYWRVGGALSDATSQDTGYLEIATADNGNEPIYVRQYTGVYNTIVRTLTLLDASGNTQFPGSISEGGSTLGNKYLQRSGTLPMTGPLDMGEWHNIIIRAKSNATSATGLVFKNSDDSKFSGIGMYSNDGIGSCIYIGFGESPWNESTGLIITQSDMKFKDKKIWREDNDGANSGLDADLLDGKHASAFSLTSHTHNYAGSASVGGPANSALKLETGRKIGNATFDGTSDITIAQMGVSPVTGSSSLTNLASTITLGNGLAGTILQNNGLIWQKITISDNDTAGDVVYTFSQSENSGNNWIELFAILDNGTIRARQFTGNSATATKFQTIRKIGDANFDGTANITVAQIGAAPTVHTHTKSQITDFPSSLKNPTSIVLKMNSGATEGTNMFTYDGSVAKTINITPSLIGAAASVHTHTKSQITDFPSSLKNPNALTLSLNGTSQGAYDGSSAKAINITPSNIGARPAGAIMLGDSNNLDEILTEGEYYAVGGNTVSGKPSDVDCFALIVQRSGAGLKTQILTSSRSSVPNKIYIRTYDSNTSNAWSTWDYLYSTRYKPTSTDVGAAPTVHTHTKSQITDFPASLKNPNSLTISLNGTSQGAYDGSAAKSFNITPASIGAALASHTHTKSQITDFPTTLPNAGALTISLNGTSQGAYNGSAAKSINITPASIGAALASHTHSYLPLTGGTVNGQLLLSQGYNVYSSNGINGTRGYVLMAEIKISGYYQNTTIVFEVINRNARSPMVLSILFSNTENTDPDLISFSYYGANIGAYIHKASASTWNLYIKKSEAYDNIAITKFSKHQTYMLGTTITWKGTIAESLPTGYIEANLQLVSSSAIKLRTSRKIGNASFDGTADITAAQMGVAPANLIYKNISVAPSAWNSTTKIYEYANASITANHIPQVFFSTGSLDAAGKAGIVVYTETGKLVLKCTVIPTVTLVMESVVLTPV